MSELTYHQDRTNQATCRSCGEPIVWLVTRNGKKMPVDLPDQDDPRRDDILEATQFDPSYMTSHFQTCPEAPAHRKAGAPAAQEAPQTHSGVLAKRLNTAMAVLESIAKNPPDGLRSVELAKACLSQIRSIR